MGIEDRDWYREEMRRRTAASGGTATKSHKRGSSNHPRPSSSSISNSPWVWTVVVLALMFAVAAVVGDMKERDVPFTLHGLRWWLSLWFGS